MKKDYREPRPPNYYGRLLSYTGIKVNEIEPIDWDRVFAFFKRLFCGKKKDIE